MKQYKKIDEFDLPSHNDENMRYNFVTDLISFSKGINDVTCCKNQNQNLEIQTIEPFQLTEPVYQINQIPEEKQNFIDIRDIVNQFNDLMKKLTDLFNYYADQINSLNLIEIPDEIGDYPLPKFNLQHAVFQPVVLESYVLPVNQNTLNFLNNLQLRIIDLYKQVINIPELIPQIGSVDETLDYYFNNP